MKPEEGGNTFNRTAFAPGSGLPKVVGSGMVEEFMGPDLFRMVDGPAEFPDRCNTLGASGVVNNCKVVCAGVTIQDQGLQIFHTHPLYQHPPL